MANNGEPSAYYGYEPGRVERGRHRMQVRLGAMQSAPAIFSTNQIEVAMSVGGGEAFVRRQFSYAKTWSQPGATLPPVMRLAQMRPRLPLQRAPFARVEQAQPPQELTPPGKAGQAGAVERRILPDGAVELHGIYFAAIQFHTGLRRRHAADPAPPEEAELSLSLGEVKIRSPVLGVIILTISPAFFYLYLVHVYPIRNVF